VAQALLRPGVFRWCKISPSGRAPLLPQETGPSMIDPNMQNGAEDGSLGRLGDHGDMEISI